MSLRGMLRFHSRSYCKVLLLVMFIAITFLVWGKRAYQHSRETQRRYITQEIKLALGSRNASEQVMLDLDTTVLNNHVCGSRNKSDPLLAVVVALSRPEEIEVRARIRAQWQKWDSKFLRHVQIKFFLGRPPDWDWELLAAVQSESSAHEDIVVDDFEDSYYGLTVKTLRMFKWFMFSCSNVQFLVKTDLDTFIHLPNLVNYLLSVKYQHPDLADAFIGGDVRSKAPLYDDPSNKWYMPPELIDPKYLESDAGSPVYPDYILGGFYVVSSPLVHGICKRSLTIPLIQFEDVFLTGIVAHQSLGLKLTNIPNVYCGYFIRGPFHYWTTYFYNDSLIARHLQGDFMTLDKYFARYQATSVDLYKT